MRDHRKLIWQSCRLPASQTARQPDRPGAHPRRVLCGVVWCVLCCAVLCRLSRLQCDIRGWLRVHAVRHWLFLVCLLRSSAVLSCIVSYRIVSYHIMIWCTKLSSCAHPVWLCLAGLMILQRAAARQANLGNSAWRGPPRIQAGDAGAAVFAFGIPPAPY